MIKVCLPSSLFLLIICFLLLAIGPSITRVIGIYGGLLLLFLLISNSNNDHQRSSLMRATGRTDRISKEKQISQYADMMFSWCFSVWLTIDMVLNSYNAVIGIIIVALNIFGILVTIESKSDVRLQGTFLASQNFGIIIRIGSVFMVIIALLSVFIGKWVWPYPFIF